VFAAFYIPISHFKQISEKNKKNAVSILNESMGALYDRTVAKSNRAAESVDLKRLILLAEI